MASKRPLALLSLPSPLRTSTCLQCRHHQIRSMHQNMPAMRIPKPTPFVPDVSAFLTLIGRNMSAHTAKIPSWDALFTLSSAQLKASGVEPPRARKYILWWRERYRNGITGVGGDLKEVKDGIAELRIAEVALPPDESRKSRATINRDAGVRQVVMNVTPTVAMPADPANPVKKEESNFLATLAPPMRVDSHQVRRVAGMKILRGNTIGGTGVEYVKGHQGVARLKVKEGLWEQKRGHKVDGGERRQAEVRAKRRAAERKNAR